MKIHIAFSALAVIILAACGNEAVEGASAAAEAAPAETISEPAPVQDLETSNRLATAGAEAEEATSRGLRDLGWEELMPDGEEERLAQLYQEQMAMLYSGAPVSEGSAADQMIQIGTFNIVPELNDLKVRIPGYTVPFDFGADAEITEFLLVPYYGACLHAPPPPPNQTIFVTTDEPIKLKDLAQAVWIEGTLHTQVQTSDLADAAYTIKLDRMTVYEY
ncbi:MAG: DUF3299 domain-containing protein [Alphaproteobacteria bacterium]|nr:DUF3299 domain-containing protein [Alphaproteobacteria bacterium]